MATLPINFAALRSPKAHRQQQQRASTQAVHFNINYAKIKRKLNIGKDASAHDQTNLLLLLQSLRWRVTKLTKHSEKRSIVVEYIKNDLFQSHSTKTISNLLRHPNVQIVETALRLFNCISSFAVGRGYLLRLRNNALINVLSDTLTATTEDNSVRMNSLGCLQKLSLRKELQDHMIEKGLIGWMIEMLDAELLDLSEYTVEYSTALLMNLTLRSKGKKQCQLNAAHVEKILNTLLKLLTSAFVAQIHTYVNGVLYSLLSEPNIRQTALKMDLIGKLNECVANYNDAAFKQQIDYIVSQLSASIALNGDHENDANGGDEESDEENEDYSETEDYEEYDVNELTDYLKQQQSQKEELLSQGDQFLFNEYREEETQNNLAANVQKLTTKRPITPQRPSQRMPKFPSPLNLSKVTEVMPGDQTERITPRNQRWMADGDYRAVFEDKHRVARTPPHAAK